MATSTLTKLLNYAPSSKICNLISESKPRTHTHTHTQTPHDQNYKMETVPTASRQLHSFTKSIQDTWRVFLGTLWWQWVWQRLGIPVSALFWKANKWNISRSNVGHQTRRVRGVVVYQIGDDSIQTHHSLVGPSVHLFFLFFSFFSLFFYILFLALFFSHNFCLFVTVTVAEHI